MITKKDLENRIRGWFPQEPKVGIIKSTNLNMKSGKYSPLPFLASGALMILAAALSAYFGFSLLNSYQASVAYYHVATSYMELYVGLLNFAAIGLDLFAAALLLLRKYVVLAEVLVGVVLAFGLASPLIFTIEGYLPIGGLIFGLPMIAFSIVTLILLRLNNAKLKQETNMRWTALPFVLSGALMILASILSAYSGLDLLLLYRTGLSTAYAAIYRSDLYVGILNLVVFGVGLVAGILLLRRKHFGFAAIFASLVVVFELASPFFSDLGGYLPPERLAFRAPTIAFSIATLIILALNRGKLKPDINANIATEISAHPKSKR